ncbi:MAG TPA: type I methionyl aminopeptidase [Bacillota bacterium]|jgi:methionyl aminopeptidase|nr:type I methionyl aminopeptidase [Bacillota bacterium]HOB86583.1 type I methionyl aminopeptidase [Bacillota bacterium]HOP68308.1 type I methionyl aminopeptidase [Bacillota bacterium]HPT33975.1 type I methionyl aminopeptidase [Bacillota bacterium]HPZ65018.1 type I methionyl aminopeptidase [Bacillota bacterium]
MINLKTPEEIALMREAGRIAARVLQELEQALAVGVTTAHLDKLAEKLIRSLGGEPAFLGYQNFPASICTSINNEVVHGIPGLRRLQEGDIISIDVGVRFKGYYGDAAATFGVGAISAEARRLIQVTRASLERGIQAMQVGGYLSDISHAVQSFVEEHNFSVVRQYVGHGIGSQMHEEPQVPNFGRPGRGPLLQPGIALAIEPMVNAGHYEVKVLEDRWTVVTKDGSLSAHFEHTVALGEEGPEILTVL